MVEIDTPEYYRIVVNAYVQTSKHEKVPYDPTIIFKIIDNFEYLLSINVNLPFNFYNLLYLTIEDQEKDGYIITPFLQELIKYHREKNISTFLTYCCEFAYLQIARQA
jgi:hypothetical protein